MTPTKAKYHKTPRKSPKKNRAQTQSLKALETLSTTDESEERDLDVMLVDVNENDERDLRPRKSNRKISPNKRYDNFEVYGSGGRRHKKTTNTSRSQQIHEMETSENDEESGEETFDEITCKPKQHDIKLVQQDYEITGKNMFGFNTPKKRDGMALAAMNVPKTPKTPHLTSKTPDTKNRKSTVLEPKTPSHVRRQLKHQIAKIVEAESDQEDFSADDDDFEPDETDSDNDSDSTSHSSSSEADDETKTPHKTRCPIVVPVLPKTPSTTKQRQSSRSKKFTDYVPMCETYFQAQSSSKIITSDHTLDRLKNPRLPADRLFSLLANMKLSSEHETAINCLRDEYRTYFPKWMYILNEGFNLLLYGLGSKRQLLQTFHREVLAQQTVLVVNGFFPSLMLKDILDSITNEILDAGICPSNLHEAVDMIEEELSLIPDTHLYLIIHNLDGTMLRNVKSQAILARLASITNIHLLASVDHINIPLLWDQIKLSNFNFSWWDCTTFLPYTDETAYENSLMVQNSGELALSSLRSVFSSLTTNSRGIYMIIVKHQLKNKGNQNYQGMPFKDLYWNCREAFLVSSDLALRAQLTEFLDHKLVKTKRGVDGSEQLTIPIASSLLQQFLDEQEKKD